MCAPEARGSTQRAAVVWVERVACLRAARVGRQVAKSVEYVAKGTEQLVQARELQRSSRKWLCASLICLIIAVVIVVISICGSGLCKF